MEQMNNDLWNLPVLPSVGSCTAPAVKRVRKPSSSNVRLMASGGLVYFADSTLGGRGRLPMLPVRVPVALFKTKALDGSQTKHPHSPKASLTLNPPRHDMDRIDQF